MLEKAHEIVCRLGVKLPFMAIMKDPVHGQYFRDRGMDNVHLYNKWKTLKKNKRSSSNPPQKLQRQAEEREMASQRELQAKELAATEEAIVAHQRKHWTWQEEALLRSGMSEYPSGTENRWTRILDDDR